MSSKTSFKYEPLQCPATDFRLLKVLPDRGLGIIQVRLWNVVVTDGRDLDGTNYRCLSYNWGDPDQMFEIYLNDTLVRIRRNLYKFLSWAAKTCPQQPFWVDALCIDQNSPIEKNIQIAEMESLYSNAEAVYIWLGNDFALLPLAQFVSEVIQGLPVHDFDTYTIEESATAFWSHP